MGAAERILELDRLRRVVERQNKELKDLKEELQDYHLAYFQGMCNIDSILKEEITGLKNFVIMQEKTITEFKNKTDVSEKLKAVISNIKKEIESVTY